MKGCFMAAAFAFVICAVMGPIIIPLLRKLKCGQNVREDGPESHLKKSGTPTMGGILILISIVVASIPYVSTYPEVAPILFMTIGFGLIGFFDDYIKIVCRRSLGLTALQKLVGQLLVTAIFVYYLLNYTDVSLAMRVPFRQEQFLDWGSYNIPFLFFVVLGTVNGVNFTDGLDGLAGSVTTMVAVFFTVVAIGVNSGIAPITCAVAGALIGFLLFNAHPAEVFMGDTGSLALGGFVAACGYMLQMPLYIAIVGLVYMMEVVSVILQVGYFRATGGKRILKMAPLHHHLELCGWSENQIVALFTIMTAFICLAALIGL